MRSVELASAALCDGSSLSDYQVRTAPRESLELGRRQHGDRCGGAGTVRSPRIELQLKCTERDIINNGMMSPNIRGRVIRTPHAEEYWRLRPIWAQAQNSN